MTKKILFRILIFISFVFSFSLSQNLLGQCKVLACNCCDERQYYLLLDSVNTVKGSFFLDPNDCSSPIGGLAWPPGATYHFVLDPKYCPQDDPITVYVTGCVCRLEPLDTVRLPCCNQSLRQRLDKSNQDLKNYKLYQNYPNPFNPSTTINFDIPEDAYVTLTIFDVTGKVIIRPINHSFLKAGYHDYIWNTRESELSSGIYFYSLKAGNFSDEKKMVLIK